MLQKGNAAVSPARLWICWNPLLTVTDGNPGVVGAAVVSVAQK